MAKIILQMEVTDEVINALIECGFSLSANGNAVANIPNTNENTADVLRLARTSPDYKPNVHEVNHGYTPSHYGK